jgi:hypothetical protein
MAFGKYIGSQDRREIAMAEWLTRRENLEIKRCVLLTGDAPDALPSCKTAAFKAMLRRTI